MKCLFPDEPEMLVYKSVEKRTSGTDIPRNRRGNLHRSCMVTRTLQNYTLVDSPLLATRVTGFFPEKTNRSTGRISHVRTFPVSAFSSPDSRARAVVKQLRKKNQKETSRVSGTLHRRYTVNRAKMLRCAAFGLHQRELSFFFPVIFAITPLSWAGILVPLLR